MQYLKDTLLFIIGMWGMTLGIGILFAAVSWDIRFITGLFDMSNDHLLAFYRLLVLGSFVVSFFTRVEITFKARNK